MKALIPAAVLLCLAMPGAASASCYFVYSAQNQLVYRSTLSPVDLSKPISEGLRGRFGGGHLTMIPDETGCPELQVNGESQVFASLGFASPGRSTSAIDASPLFRNAASRDSMPAPTQAGTNPAVDETTARPSPRRSSTPAPGGRGK